MTKAEGIYGCQVIGGKAGEVDGVMNVQITVQITDGPDKGQRCTYEDTVNASSAKYVNWSLSAAGWKGKAPEWDFTTLEKDIEEWIAKTGGASTVEIKHIEIKRGKAFDKWEAGGRAGPRPVWDKVAGIGRGAARAMKAPSAETLKGASGYMREAMGDMGGPPPDDVPHAGDEDAIPFVTSSMRDLTAVARVLR